MDGNQLVIVLILVVACCCRFACCSNEFLKANMNSYNVQVTTNTKGSMFKFRSPETDVKSNFKEPAKVEVYDALLPLALVTKKKADVVLFNPRMSVSGNVKQDRLPVEQKEVHILEPINRTEVADKKFAKNRNNAYKILKALPKIESGMRRHSGTESLKLNNSNDKMRGSDSENETESEESGDDADDEISGSQENEKVADEKTKENADKTNNQKVLNFPPKVPEIPIELGVLKKPANKTRKLKQMTAIRGRQHKPCQKGSCVEPTNDGKGGDDGKSEEEPPQPDIPIELGVINQQPQLSEDQYEVTYIDQKTPSDFILLEDDEEEGRRRRRRSVTGIKRNQRHPQPHHKHNRHHRHHRHHHHHHLNKKKKWHHRNKKHKSNHHHRKRSGIMPYGYYYWKPQKRAESQPIDKPVRAYLRTLAKDVRNVMGQAKQVLQNTGQVVHGLKRILGGASILSAITSDAVKYAKYFTADVRNASLEYLQEKAIVALITAEQSAKEAEEAAVIARSASDKANAAERRMDIANNYQKSPEVQKYAQFAETTKNQAVQANKAYKFASDQREKTRKVASFLDKNLQRMSKFVGKEMNIGSIESKALSKIAAGTKVDTTESYANKKEDMPQDNAENEKSEGEPNDSNGTSKSSETSGSINSKSEESNKDTNNASVEEISNATKTETSSSTDTKSDESNKGVSDSFVEEVSKATKPESSSSTDTKLAESSKDKQGGSVEETSKDTKPKGFLIRQHEKKTTGDEETTTSVRSPDKNNEKNSSESKETESSPNPEDKTEKDSKSKEIDSSTNKEEKTGKVTKQETEENKESKFIKSSQIDSPKKDDKDKEEEEELKLLRDEKKSTVKSSNETSQQSTSPVIDEKKNTTIQNEDKENASHNVTTPSQTNENATKKRVVAKPHYLVPGEYTGFKRDLITKADDDADEDEDDNTDGSQGNQDAAPIKRFKSIGTYSQQLPSVSGETSVSNQFADNNVNTVLPAVTNIISRSETPDKGSGDNTQEEAEEVAQLLKQPITVSVHVSKRKDETTTDSAEEKHSEIIEDPFGFKKHFPDRKQTNDYNVDPFGFKKFLKSQKQGSAVNERRNIVTKPIGTNDLEWD